MTFSRRHIDLTFQLGEGSFGESGFNTLKVTGLRCMASITKAGGVGLTNLNLRVYGLTKTVMNALSTLGKPLPAVRNNVITVEAGDDDTGMAVVFIGIIQQGWADLQGAPDGVFTVEAATGLLELVKPVPPTSFNGSVDAATVMSGLANQMGFAFENTGVSVQIAYPYLHGTALDQAQQLAEAANINFLLDGATLAIWPKGQVRGGEAILISPETGLVGYPMWTAQGLSITTLFNPSIAYGGKIQVQSEITPACGLWSPFKVGHDLESEVPNGRWFTTLEASTFGTVALAQ